jgi:glycosyltransferase involved in cell wall biosynthesis
MKIVFDAYWWVHGPPSLRHVLREIVNAWAREFPEDRIVLVVRNKDRRKANRDLPPNARARSTRLAATFATAQVARREAADVIFSHNFAARSRNAKSVIYLHDVLFVTNPEWFTLAERLYFSFMVRWAKRADVIFTSSQTEAKRIRSVTKSRRVVPVGLGLSSELADQTESDAIDELQGRHFLLTVGRLNIRKNLEKTILGALKSGRVSAEMPLVVVGAPNGKKQVIAPEITAAVRSGKVFFTGFVSESQLRWLYEHADLFLFLSLGEGYGMPPVEARHFGAPLLVSDLPVFREILGTSARYVEPNDLNAISAAIAAFIDSAHEGSDPLASGSSEAMPDWTSIVAAMRLEILRVPEHQL